VLTGFRFADAGRRASSKWSSLKSDAFLRTRGNPVCGW